MQDPAIYALGSMVNVRDEERKKAFAKEARTKFTDPKNWDLMRIAIEQTTSESGSSSSETKNKKRRKATPKKRPSNTELEHVTYQEIAKPRPERKAATDARKNLKLMVYPTQPASTRRARVAADNDYEDESSRGSAAPDRSLVENTGEEEEDEQEVVDVHSDGSGSPHKIANDVRNDDRDSDEMSGFS